jgi:hypothetical protein
VPERLRRTIPPARLSRYEDAVAGTAVDALDLYAWNRSVSLALFDDIATLEVAMRSAMAASLRATYGDRWFARDDLFDDDTESAIVAAWRQGGLTALEREDASPDLIHGKLVASFMYGFWVKLLGRGEFSRKNPPFKQRRIYDTTLWRPALSSAFSGVAGDRRSDVQSAAKKVQYVRNRIAHHEHVIWGVPIPDRRDADGRVLRLDVAAAHDVVVELAGFLDAELATWLIEQTDVHALLRECPLPEPEPLRIGAVRSV